MRRRWKVILLRQNLSDPHISCVLKLNTKLYSFYSPLASELLGWARTYDEEKRSSWDERRNSGDSRVKKGGKSTLKGLRFDLTAHQRSLAIWITMQIVRISEDTYLAISKIVSDFFLFRKWGEVSLIFNSKRFKFTQIFMKILAFQKFIQFGGARCP